MMRKTSIDIPAQIAEGAAKPNDAEFARLVSGALGFANRLEYYAVMAHDLGFLDAGTHSRYAAELVEVKKIMGGFNRRLAASNA